uniref:ARAD1C33242p n=1 Tax=Blastobotrys adeninivorans TaxID=409370 RepID=A0A060T307_BLAAD
MSKTPIQRRLVKDVWKENEADFAYRCHGRGAEDSPLWGMKAPLYALSAPSLKPSPTEARSVIVPTTIYSNSTEWRPANGFRSIHYHTNDVPPEVNNKINSIHYAMDNQDKLLALHQKLKVADCRVIRVEAVPGHWHPQTLFNVFAAFCDGIMATFIYKDKDEHGRKQGLVQVRDDEVLEALCSMKQIVYNGCCLQVYASSVANLSQVLTYDGVDADINSYICTEKTQDLSSPTQSQGMRWYPMLFPLAMPEV